MFLFLLTILIPYYQLYLKNADVIERLATIDAVVFDKTGTVTHGRDPEVDFRGTLSQDGMTCVKFLTSCSTHPLSSLIAKSIRGKPAEGVINFREWPGQGIEGTLKGHFYRIGSSAFVGYSGEKTENTTCVFVSIDGQVRGYFSMRVMVRMDIEKMLKRLGPKCVALLSGDSDTDSFRMRALFPPQVTMYFNQSPHDKMEFICNLQRQGKKVLMVGDGLNDAGALKQSDVGIAVTDDTGVFTPACDGILQGDQIVWLDKFLTLAKSATVILKFAFVISFLYNGIALGFAVTGHLTPIVAAVLMPLSSISVVSFSTLAVSYTMRKNPNQREALEKAAFERFRSYQFEQTQY